MKAKTKGSMTVVHVLTIVGIVQTLTCSVLVVMMECTYMKTDALTNAQSKFILCIHVSVYHEQIFSSEFNE